jgi:hypothetical protein
MPREAAQRTGEIVIGFALALLGVCVLAAAQKMPFGSIASPGPGVMPAALGALLLLAGGLVALAAWRATPREARVALGHADVIGAIAALVAAGFLFETLGAPLVLAVFLTALFRLLARTSWWRALLGGVLGSAATWLFFVQLLDVQLPFGPGR